MYNKMIENYAQQIREALDLRKVAEAYGIEFDRNGYACCPFHAEKTGSFIIQGKWGHCFGCGANTDVIKLTRQLFGLRFFDAVNKLNSDFNIGLPLDYKPSLREHLEFERKQRERAAKAKVLEAKTQEWEEDYWRLWDLWIGLDRVRREYAPKSVDEPFDPVYVAALQNIDYISYLIDTLPTLKSIQNEGGDSTHGGSNNERRTTYR